MLPYMHVGAAARHVVDHAEDRLLVARDDARAQHHRVALLHRDVLVVVHRHARQRRHRLALRAGNQDRHLVRRQVHHVLRAQQDAIGNAEQAERVGDLGDRDHAAADDRHAAAVFLRQVEHQLDAVNRGAEAGNHDRGFSARLKISSMRGARRARSRCSRAGRNWWNRRAAAARRACRNRPGCAGRTARCRWGWGRP